MRELADVADARTRQLPDPRGRTGFVDRAARQTLLGCEVDSLEQLTKEIAATSTDDVRDTMRELLRTAILTTPEREAALAPRFNRVPQWSIEAPAEGKAR